MADTYTQLYIQLVFAVKYRESLIEKEFKDELYKYIAGILRNQNQKLLAINGMPDHIHIFFGLTPDVKISDLVRDIKSDSSLFINQTNKSRKIFRWQNGFGAFSYSKSHKDAVIKYILNQEEHHRKKSFQEEYKNLLEKFEVEYKAKYLFEFFD
jgi:putative transposase